MIRGYLSYVLALGLVIAILLNFSACNDVTRSADNEVTHTDTPVEPAGPVLTPTFEPTASLFSSGTASYKFPYQNYQPPVDTLDVVFDSSGNPILRSACGVFKSTDHGNTFAPMSFPGVEAETDKLAFDGSNVYVGTPIGLYKSSNSGTSFQLILDRNKAQAIINSSPPALKCVNISLGPAFPVRQVFADGNLILASTNIGVLRSTDGGTTFAPIVVSNQGYMMPPAHIITKISKKGSSIYISNEWAGPSAANVFNTFHVGTSEACALNPALPGVAMIVSTDGGATFTGAPGVGTLNIIHNYDFSSARTHVLSAYQHYYSSLDGQTFIGSSSTSFSPSVFENSAETYPLAVTPSRVFATRSSSSNRRSLILVESLNDGLTFADRQIDPQVSAADLVVAGVFAHGSDVYLASDHGLYVSRDGGATFPVRKRFSSDFCTLPWWKYSTVRGFVGNNVFAVFPGFTGLRSSTDQGLRFIAGLPEDAPPPGIPNGDRDIYLSRLTNMTSIGSSIHWGFNAGGVTKAVSSFDGGKTFQPFVQDDPRYNGKKIYFLGTSFGTFYVSADGVDERPQLQALDPASVYIGAYSIGGRMIVSRYGDGLLVLRGNQIEHAYPETGGWPKIREYGGVIYAIGTVTMVSFDKGASFQRAPGSPYFANDLIAFDNKVQLISNGSIYESTDGGHNFHLLVGKLE